jgi:hypothetical protein
MSPRADLLRHGSQRACMLIALLLDAVRLLRLCLRPSTALAAENLFLRTQLALYQERQVKPRRAINATRLTLVWLAQWFDWRAALTLVHPETFRRWQRQGFGRLWRSTSCPGRPPLPVALQGLIRQMGRDNLTWGQQRIANALRLKLGLQVSPRTVRKYLPQPLDHMPGHHMPSQRWRTFLRNQVQALIISRVPMDFTRGVQALVARLMRPLPQGWDRPVVNGLPGTSPCDAVAMARRRDSMPTRVTWSPDTGDSLSVMERSPPTLGSPPNHGPCLDTRATQVDTVGVCPVAAALDRWDRASPHPRGAQSLHHGETRATPWQRVA